MSDLNFKELDRKKRITHRSSKKKVKGARPISPWYHLIGGLEKSYIDKTDVAEDFSVTDFKPIKIKVRLK